MNDFEHTNTPTGMTPEEIAEGLLHLPKEAVHEVVKFFSLRELQILAGIEGIGDLAYEELNTRYRGLFATYDLPAEGLKKLMREDGVIMSGSCAAYITNPGNYMPGDVDIYAPAGRLLAVVRVFVEKGWKLVPWGKAEAGSVEEEESMLDDMETEDDYTDNDSSSNDERSMEFVWEGTDENNEDDVLAALQLVLREEKQYAKHVIKNVVILQKGGEDGPKVNVVESLLPCAEAPIFCFHSTVVMNAVTSKGVVCYYPDWTFQNKGVVNRASGIVAWVTKERKREIGALAKYRARGYKIEDDCGALHEKGEETCVACAAGVREWNDGLSMTFERGDVFRPAGRLFSWKLGKRMCETEKLAWKDRGATIFVQGEGDGRAYVYEGTEKRARSVTEERMKLYM